MLDLLAAGDAGRHDERVRVRRFHRGGEPAVAERDGQVIVLALEAERAGHATASGIDLADVVARPLQHGHRRRRADHGLLVAVAVQQHLAPVAVGEAQGQPALALAQEELLEEQALLGHRARVVGAQQVDPLVAQGQRARGLEPHDGHAPPRVGRQARHVPRRVLARLVEHALGDQRPAAALAIHQHDAVAGALEQADGGAADLRRVVADERVVEKHDLAARRARRRRMAAEPVLESLRRQRGQRPAAIDPDDLLEQPAHRWQRVERVRQPRGAGPQRAELRDAPEDPVSQRQAVGLVVMVEELVLQLRHVDVGRALGLAALALQAQVHHRVQALAGELAGGQPA